MFDLKQNRCVANWNFLHEFDLNQSKVVLFIHNALNW